MEENKKEKYVLLQTKVAPRFFRTFRHICKKKGMNTYQVLQMMADAFVRYTDDQHNLSEEMERLMAIFEHVTGWKDAFNLADASADRDITEAVYFLTANGRKGARAVMVHRPYMGNWTETVNVQNIMERMLEVLSPDRYRRLRALEVDNDCNSILELLDLLITRSSKDADEAQYRKDFEDCRRGDFGQEPKEDGPYVRKHHKSVDMYEQQTAIQFGPSDTPIEGVGIPDKEEERQWLDENMDFKPHGYEW